MKTRNLTRGSLELFIYNHSDLTSVQIEHMHDYQIKQLLMDIIGEFNNAEEIIRSLKNTGLTFKGFVRESFPALQKIYSASELSVEIISDGSGIMKIRDKTEFHFSNEAHFRELVIREIKQHYK